MRCWSVLRIAIAVRASTRAQVRDRFGTSTVDRVVASAMLGIAPSARLGAVAATDRLVCN
nr:hypothetical protein [Mycobacterium pseudoshottsii]